jgi:signal transduction histidine kinase
MGQALQEVKRYDARLVARSLFDLNRLEERGILGESPSPAFLGGITFLSVAAIGTGMFLLGGVQTSTQGILVAVVAMAGLAVAVGAALAVMQFRWAEQLDRAHEEGSLLLDQLQREREHHRHVVHDAKAATAALGAATHALRQLSGAQEVVDAMEAQLAQLRASLDSKSVEVEPFHVEDVLGGLQAFTSLHDVDLVVRPTTQLVLGDATATLQILQNLVDNSRKYAPASTVRVWAEPAGPNHTIVVVEDDGMGIDTDAVEMLFKAGVRRGSGTQGFGQGLAIARQLAEAQGGALWYDDSWTGARFVLKLRNAEAE